MKNKITLIIGAIIFFSGIILAWAHYGWQLALILFLVLTGTNIENRIKNNKR